MSDHMADYKLIEPPVEPPELSEWHCYMFGSRPDNEGITWRPNKGQEPNWFWRWMQFICFGNLWIKENDQ